MTMTMQNPNRRRGPVEIGDIIVFLGHPHLVASLDDRTDAGDPIARDAEGWGIVLDADGWLRIPSPSPTMQVIAGGAR